MESVTQVLERYRRNFPAFEQELGRLERDHLGEFAVVEDGKVINVYSTEEQARAGASGDSVIFEIGHHRLRFATLTT